MCLFLSLCVLAWIALSFGSSPADAYNRIWEDVLPSTADSSVVLAGELEPRVPRIRNLRYHHWSWHWRLTKNLSAAQASIIDAHIDATIATFGYRASDLVRRFRSPPNDRSIGEPASTLSRFAATAYFNRNSRHRNPARQADVSYDRVDLTRFLAHCDALTPPESPADELASHRLSEAFVSQQPVCANDPVPRFSSDAVPALMPIVNALDDFLLHHYLISPPPIGLALHDALGRVSVAANLDPLTVYAADDSIYVFGHSYLFLSFYDSPAITLLMQRPLFLHLPGLGFRSLMAWLDSHYALFTLPTNTTEAEISGDARCSDACALVYDRALNLRYLLSRKRFKSSYHWSRQPASKFLAASSPALTSAALTTIATPLNRVLRRWMEEKNTLSNTQDDSEANLPIARATDENEASAAAAALLMQNDTTDVGAAAALPNWHELVVRLALAALNGLPYCRFNATQTRKDHDRDARQSISPSCARHYRFPVSTLLQSLRRSPTKPNAFSPLNATDSVCEFQLDDFQNEILRASDLFDRTVECGQHVDDASSTVFMRDNHHYVVDGAYTVVPMAMRNLQHNRRVPFEAYMRMSYQRYNASESQHTNWHAGAASEGDGNGDGEGDGDGSQQAPPRIEEWNPSDDSKISFEEDMRCMQLADEMNLALLRYRAHERPLERMRKRSDPALRSIADYQHSGCVHKLFVELLVKISMLPAESYPYSRFSCSPK
jgi:hypothetical protein